MLVEALPHEVVVEEVRENGGQEGVRNDDSVLGIVVALEGEIRGYPSLELVPAILEHIIDGYVAAYEDP